jgi:hypothetical protein
MTLLEVFLAIYSIIVTLLFLWMAFDAYTLWERLGKLKRGL